MRIQLVPRAAQVDLLDLPWSEPLEEWESTRLVDVPRGIGRHVVRFVDDGGVFYALKELPAESRPASTGSCGPSTRAGSPPSTRSAS